MIRPILALVVALAGCTEQAVIGRDLASTTATGGGPGDDVVWDATVDADGNAYVVGTFEERLVIGDDTHLAGASGLGAFVASYDRAGAPRWSRAWSASGFTYAGHVEVEGDAVYVLGYASGTLSTPGGAIDAGGSQDLLLLTFDRAGDQSAAPLTFASTAGNAQGKAIDADGSRLAIVGHYVGDVDLGAGPLGATGGMIDHGLLGTFDAGALVWGRNLDGADVLLEGALLAPGGGLYASGHYRNGAVLGTAAQGDFDGIVVALDGTGAERWHHTVGTAGTDRYDAIAAAPGGGVILGGVVTGDHDFGHGVTAAHGGLDGFVARYDADGALAWARRIGGPGDDLVSEVAVSADGTIAVAGSFSDTVSHAGTDLVSAGDLDAMVVSLTADGADGPWAHRLGGPGRDEAQGVGFDGAEVVVAGRASDNADLSGVTLTSAGGTDVFLVRFVP